MKRKARKRKHGLSQMQRLLQQSVRHSVQIASLLRRVHELEMRRG